MPDEIAVSLTLAEILTLVYSDELLSESLFAKLMDGLPYWETLHGAQEKLLDAARCRDLDV